MILTIILVINPEDGNPVVYSAVKSRLYKQEIKDASDALKLGMDSDDILECAEALLDNRPYWYKEQYCFTKV